MISKTGIQEFTSYYHRYSWLINIPFVIYFGISFFQIGKMKCEINLIQEVLVDQAFKNVANSQKSYENISFSANRYNWKRSLYQPIQIPLQKVQSSNFVLSEDWIGELSSLENQIQELCEVSETIFKYEEYQLQWGYKYPAIRSYISSKYATDMMSILYSYMYRGGSATYLCDWLYPIIQKYGDDLLLYASAYNKCSPTYSEFWVNGVKLEKNKYLFKPTHSGIHSLDIEYKYLHQEYSPEAINVKKELMVN